MAKSIVPLLVRRIVIDLGCGIELDAYTADERRKDGSFINYLSSFGMANAIEKNASTTLDKTMSKRLKSRLGDGFTTTEGVYLNKRNSKTRLLLWDTRDASKYFLNYAMEGNEKAAAIVEAFISASLDTIINDAFGRDYESGDTGRHVKDYLRDTPKEWDLHFDKKWQNAAVRCLGIPWQGQTMARFIVDYIYKELEIWEELQELNTDPAKNRYFQYIEEVADNAAVRKHINIIYTLLCRSLNRAEFKRAYFEMKYDHHMQLSMF